MSCELSAASFQLSRIITTTGGSPGTSGSYAALREYCIDGPTVRDELCAEAFLQFRVFHADHYGAGCDGEGREEPADGEAGPDAPGQHFAQVGEIDGMADAGADAGGDEALIVVAGAEFGQASELPPAEVSAGTRIDHDACGEQEGGGEPRPRCRIDNCAAPRAGEGGDADPHDDPGGK